MSKTAENPAIGLDNVVIAELLTDNGGTTPPTYGEVIPLKGAVTASVNPNSSVETDYADNGAFFVADNRANIEMSLELTNVDPDVLAKMLGQKRENGITVEGSQDQAPYFAMGFRVWIGGLDENGDKIYELFWYAKGKFSVPESGGNTKQDTIEFQHKSITAQFVSTLFSPDGKGGIYCVHGRTDYDLPATVANNWFNAPVLVTDGDYSKLTVTIAQQGTNKSKITITGSKESTNDMVFAEGSIKLGQNLIVSLEGEEVPGVISVADDVITFTAETPFEASDSVSVVVTNGVKDTNGVGVTPKIEVITIA